MQKSLFPQENSVTVQI